MKLNEKERNELIKYRIEQAKETFSVIELLIDNEKYPLLLIEFITDSFILCLLLD